MILPVRGHSLSRATQDVFDYNLAPLWLKGIDGAGTKVAVIEGWDNPSIAKIVAGFDAATGLPNPQIQTIFPSGPLPKKCPHRMVIPGSYGSCQVWAQGELPLDVLAVHLMAPYAKIVISAMPADSQEPDDAASNVAPPEMMHALEYISAHHSGNVISISDETGETTYSSGPVEITYMIDPSMPGLSPGKHTARLSGMVLTTTASFSSH